MKTYGRVDYIATFYFEVSGQLHAAAALPPGIHRYPLDRSTSAEQFSAGGNFGVNCERDLRFHHQDQLSTLPVKKSLECCRVLKL
jgi:hypothetical protein